MVRKLMFLAFTNVLFALGSQSGGHANLSLHSRDIIGDLVLKALNKARDTTINPAIAHSMPDPLNINVGKSGKSDAGCIIPNPFGGCICDASASYSVSMKDVEGLKGFHVENFTSATVSADSTSFTIGADIADQDVIPRGDAHAGVGACGISPSASGSASTHVSFQKMHLEATATGELDLDKGCVKLTFTKINITFDEVSLHDTSLELDLGPIPGVDIGNLVDLVTGLSPDLTSAVEKAVQGPISDAITNAAASGDIPCIKIPIEAVPSELDAVVV